MARNEPTTADLMEMEREIMQRRGERADRAKAEAAKAEAEAAKSRPPADPAAQPTFVMGEPRRPESEVLSAAAAYRANYANYDEEIAALMEARLVAALTADGYTVPPIPPEDRLKVLRQRAAKGN